MPWPFHFRQGTENLSGRDRVCRENELVIDAWSPIHLRSALNDHYWKCGKKWVSTGTFWEDSLEYLYLPRLKNRTVLTDLRPKIIWLDRRTPRRSEVRCKWRSAKGFVSSAPRRTLFELSVRVPREGFAFDADDHLGFQAFREKRP